MKPDACSIHFTPLVWEEGGTTAPTIHGRWYCPTCQAALNAQLNAQETRTTMTETTTDTVPLRLVAEYQVFGDTHGKEFMDAVLGAAVESGAITAYHVTGSFVSFFGIQLVTFTVDLNEHHSASIEEICKTAASEAVAQATGYGEDLLNRIIGDSDVSVRAITWDNPDECAEGGHINDDNPGRPICKTCDDDPNVAALHPVSTT